MKPGGNPKRWLAAGCLGFVVLSLAGVGASWWRREAALAAWQESIPEKPDLAGWPAELVQRVDAAEARALAGPAETAALGELSRLYHANGFLAEADLGYSGLLRFDPREPRWPHLRTSILAGYGRLEEALPLLEKTVALAPEYVPAWIRLGDVRLKVNDAAGAVAAYEAVLARDPRDPYALLGLARCELQTERWTAARVRLQQAVADNPEFSAAWSLLATVYERLGNTAGAANARARAEALGRFRDPPDPWLAALMDDCYDVYRLRVAAAAASHSRDLPGALAPLERAAALAPDHAGTRRDLGNVLLGLRQFERARVHLERAAGLEPDNDLSYLDLIALAQATGDGAGQARALAAGLERCPGSAGLHFAAGRKLLAAGEAARALAEFEIVRRLRPEMGEAYREIADLHFKAGRDEAGVSVLREAMAIDPAHVPTLLELAHRALDANRADEAADCIRRLTGLRFDAAGQVEALVADFKRRFGREP